jgi:hypothetical protein
MHWPSALKHPEVRTLDPKERPNDVFPDVLEPLCTECAVRALYRVTPFLKHSPQLTPQARRDLRLSAIKSTEMLVLERK